VTHALRFKKNAGMTLLEVMVALAVLSIAGLTVMKTASQNLNSLASLEEKSLALWVAQNQLAELRLGAISVSSSGKTTEVTFADRTWYVKTTSNSTSYSGLAAIRVDVMTSKKSKSTVASITSYVNQ
jgi:general secretion pathway protein I